jgi:MFS transporter, ACS family, solute carrier family 17 (sodium-dependent inorganic phosphate cotransporter), other
MAIVYGLKVNLSVAMVAMLNHTHLAEQSALLHQHINISADTVIEPVCQGSNSTELVEVNERFLY